MKKVLEEILQEVIWIDSLIGFIGILFILSGALFVQFFYGEQPCPLCLLQRAGLVGVGISLSMNLRYGNRASHWAMAIISACAGIAVSIRQILLHITDPVGFASPVWGLHLYTWCFIAFAAVIIGSALMLLIYPEK